MQLSFPGWTAAAVLLFSGALPAQSFKQDISLANLGNGSPERPFGIAYEPVTGRIFVAVAGTFAEPNDVVAVIDPATESVVGTIPVGLFPEDLAFAYDAQGALLCGAVTNSTSGTVTIWDAAQLPVATVTLPDPFGFGSCYPFGIAASADSTRFCVTTVDGSGDVHAIDVATLGLDPSSSFNLGPGTGGRLRLPAGEALVPTARYNADFDGSEGGLTAWNTPAGAPAWERVLSSRDDEFVFPAGQEVELLPDGTRVLGGTFFDNRLYLLAPDGEILRTIRTSTYSGSAHGLALSEDGTLLAVCDLAGDTLALVDMLNLEEIAVVDLTQVGQGYSQPNDAVFVGGELYVSCQGSREVVVFDGLPTVTPGPGFAGDLTVSDSAPPAGGHLLVSATGPGKVALLWAADDQPSPFMGVPLLIGPHPKILATGAGVAARTFQIPALPKLRGRNAFFQGVTDVLGARLPTAPRVVVVQ